MLPAHQNIFLLFFRSPLSHRMMKQLCRRSNGSCGELTISSRKCSRKSLAVRIELRRLRRCKINPRSICKRALELRRLARSRTQRRQIDTYVHRVAHKLACILRLAILKIGEDNCHASHFSPRIELQIFSCKFFVTIASFDGYLESQV